MNMPKRYSEMTPYEPKGRNWGFERASNKS